MIKDSVFPDWEKDDALSGFDIDLTGIDCAEFMEMGDEPRCPFNPGCGFQLAQCPRRQSMRQRRAMISFPTRKQQ